MHILYVFHSLTHTARGPHTHQLPIRTQEEMPRLFSPLLQLTLLGTAAVTATATAAQASAARSSAEPAAATLVLVDLGGEGGTPPPVPTKVAALSCVGLDNRRVPGSAYALLQSTDKEWLENTRPGLSAAEAPVPAEAYIRTCLSGPSANGVILYNATAQRSLVPLMITLAGVLDAVPLPMGSPLASGASVVLDAATVLGGMSDLAATTYVYEHHVNETTALAFMNPGYDVHGHPIDPPLTTDVDPSLTDFIVKERIFNFWLNAACLPLTKEHALMERMSKENPWPRPIPVYGYNDALPIAGDLFEAETLCVSSHDMGEIATTGVSNLAYFSSAAPIRGPVHANRAKEPTYNASKIYLGLIVGDGDNIAMVKGSRQRWMQDRTQRCSTDPTTCFDLMWTLSPHLLRSAPAIFRWYQNQSLGNGHDFFVLPPSGDLYSYPALMSDDDQARHVANTEADCAAMSSTGIVDWEWAFTWPSAIKHYFPRYAPKGVVHAIFPVNVPFLLPIFAFKSDEYFKVFGNSTVLFRPREWRGSSGKAHEPFSKKFYLTAEEMAAEIHSYPPGTAAAIYLTSDGGGKLDDFYDLVSLLDERVEILSDAPLAKMALAAQAARFSS